MSTPGRRPSTTRARISAIAIDLFTDRGFEETSVDDIAAAAGIARRTLFRYYPSKNAIAWGDFDDHLAGMRDHLAALPETIGLADALRSSARQRLAPRLGLRGDAAPPAVVAAVGQRCGLDPQTVAPILYGQPPASDTELVDLARALDDIERQVAQS